MSNIFRKSYKKDKRGILRPTRKQVPVADRRGVSRTGFKQSRMARVKTRNRPINALAGKDRSEQVRICIQRKLGGIGDVLMTTPTLEELKNRYPNCVLTYATQPGMLSELLNDNPYVDEVIDFKNTNPSSYHLFADVTTTGLSYEKSTNPPKNRIDMFAEYVGIRLSNYKPTYVVSQKERAWGSKILEKWFDKRSSYKLVFLDIASIDQRRSWPVKNSVRLVGEINALRKDVRFVVNDFNRCLGRTWDHEHCYDISAYGVREKAALVEQCDLFIGPDSGFLHIAGALEKNIVATFGSTPAAARINHYQNAIAVEPEIACRGCWYKHCPVNYKCMQSIEPFRVRDAALAKLDDSYAGQGRSLGQPVNIYVMTPESHEAQTTAHYLAAGLQDMDIAAQLDPSTPRQDSIVLEIIKSSLIKNKAYPITPTCSLKIAYLLVEENELSREAVKYITRGYDLLLTNTKTAMKTIADSGISQPVYYAGMPLYRMLKLSRPSRVDLRIGTIISNRDRSNFEALRAAYDRIHEQYSNTTLVVLDDLSQKRYDQFWSDLNIFVDTTTNSSGFYAKEAMLRGVLAIAPYNHNTCDIPGGLFYGLFGEEERYIHYDEIGTRLGKGQDISQDTVYDALSEVIESYRAQLELVPQARDWALRNTAQPQLATIVSFIHQKLVNK